MINECMLNEWMINEWMINEWMIDEWMITDRRSQNKPRVTAGGIQHEENVNMNKTIMR